MTIELDGKGRPPSKPGRYCYSMSVACKVKECGRSGAKHPVDMFDDSATFGICTPCRFGVKPEPEQKKRRKRSEAA